MLVVDDEEHVCDVVAGALRNHEYDVETVHDGTSALNRIEQDVFDVILTDLSMPGELKGLSLYDVIEEKDPDVASRIVFLTGHTSDDELRLEIEAREAPCIEKPFDIRELARVVNEVAARRPLPTDG